MINKHQIIADLKNHLYNNYGPSVKQVILFGSQTKGNQKGYSDYDVLIVLDKDYSWQDENRILDLCYDVDLKYNILIDVHLLSDRDISSLRGRQPYIMDALKNGIYA